MKKIAKTIIISVICLIFFSNNIVYANVSNIELTSKNAALLDYTTGNIILNKDMDTLVPIASITKLVTAYLVFEAIHNNQCTEYTEIFITEHAYEVAHNYDLTNVPLKLNQKYTIKSLLETMLIVSACGSSVALAEYISGTEENFVNNMNNLMQKLKLNGQFEDSYGLSENNRMSAKSLAMFARLLIYKYPEILNYTKLESIKFNNKTYKNTNAFLRGNSAEYVGTDGLKTGSTTPAGKCIVVTTTKNNRRLIAIVLGGENYKNRNQDITNMLNYGFEHLPIAKRQNCLKTTMIDFLSILLPNRFST